MLDLRPLPNTTAAPLDDLDDDQLDELPFGVICIDPTGIVLRYNLYESRLARLDRNQVVGRQFFGEIAPCTKTEEFEGRFRRVVRGDATVAASFDFVFDFRFGSQTVSVEILPARSPERWYLTINRREVKPLAAEGPSPDAGVTQIALEPEEDRLGVLRDARERRLVEVQAPFFAALRATCDQLAPGSWHLFATEWGTQWGRRVAIELEASAKEESGKELRALSMTAVAEAIGSYLARQGWGVVHFEFEGATEGVLSASLARSALAEASSRREREAPLELSCPILAGCLAGILSHVAGRPLVAREVACSGSGAACCEFVVVAGARREALDALVGGGLRTVATIRQALRATSERPVG